jgi:hypothetical protein
MPVSDQLKLLTLMRQLLVCFLILFLLGDPPCWAGGAIAGSLVENGSRSPSIPNVRGNSGGQSGIIGKLAPGDSKSSTDTTWSQDLTLDVNGPIPVIVVDQFGVFWLNTSVDGIECVRAVIIPPVAQICFDSGPNALSAAAAQAIPPGSRRDFQ